MFIDLTIVNTDDKQSYATLNTDFIKLIESETNVIHLAYPGEYIEVTDESMVKLLDTLEDVGLIIGQNYKLPEEEK